MSPDCLDLLIHPDTFFARKTRELPDFVVPVLIVASISLLSLVAPYFPGVLFPHTVPVTVIVALPDTLMALAGPFVAWFLIALCLFAICRSCSGTGTFRATLSSAGYGMLPIALVTLIGVLASPLLSPGYVAMIPLWAMMAAIYGGFFVYVVFLVWSGYLWMIAMEKVHAVSRNHAFFAATGSLFLYLVWGVLRLLILAFTAMVLHW